MTKHLCCACVVPVLLLARLTLASAAEGEIKVDLAKVTFKVPEDRASLFGYNEFETKLFYYTAGSGEATVKLPADGDYELVIKASCDPALDERAKFKVALGGEAVGKETLLTDDLAKDYKFTLKGKAGEHKLAIEYTNDVYKEGEYDRNFYVHAVTLKPVK